MSIGRVATGIRDGDVADEEEGFEFVGGRPVLFDDLGFDLRDHCRISAPIGVVVARDVQAGNGPTVTDQVRFEF